MFEQLGIEDTSVSTPGVSGIDQEDTEEVLIGGGGHHKVQGHDSQL